MFHLIELDKRDLIQFFIFITMNFIKKFNRNNAHIYFFYLFLFSIPFQTRKVFLTSYSFYSGAFTEYATFFIYASDIFLALTLIFWLVFNKKIYHRLKFKTSLSYYFKLFRNEKFLNIKNTNKLPAAWLLLFIFIIWLIINIIINNNFAEISAFYIFKFFELFLLIIYLYFSLRNKNKLITALFVISFTGFSQSLIAIYQFTSQSPLFKNPFLHRLIGESTVYPQLPGIAKIVINNEKLVRAYGTFPHPNILGGFLILTIIITIYLLLEHKKGFLSSIKSKLNTFYNINNIKSQEHIAHAISLFWIVFVFVQIIALFFTFSRTAWVGFLLSLLVIAVFYFFNYKIVSRETIGINRIKNLFFLLSQIFFRSDGVNFHQHKLQENVRSPIYLTFVKIVQKISSIETYWIPAFAGMTKSKRNLNKLKNRIVSRETICLDKRKTVNQDTVFGERYLLKNIKNITIKQKELFIIFLLTILLITVYFPLFKGRLDDNLINSSSYLLNNSAISDRNFYNNVSRETISENFIFGSGTGTFIFQIDKYLDRNKIYQEFEPWQYQPAHNIYFLIASEIGLVGLLLFLFFIFRVISNSLKSTKTILNGNAVNPDISDKKIVSRETISATKLNYFLIAITISFLFIGLFDHYFWTLQQGSLVFWLVLGLILIDHRDK